MIVKEEPETHNSGVEFNGADRLFYGKAKEKEKGLGCPWGLSCPSLLRKTPGSGAAGKLAPDWESYQFLVIVIV